MSLLIFYALVGGATGAVIGYFSKRKSGARPLTSNWRRGGIYGAALACVFYLLAGGTSSTEMNESTANVTRIDENQFDAEVLHSPKPVVVDFYATWCVPCKILSPRLDSLASSFTNQIKFVKINVDEAPNLYQCFNLQGIPTLLFFKDGEVVDRILGLQGSHDLKIHLESLAGASQPQARFNTNKP